MKQKRPKIDPELQRPLQDYANLHYDGNVTRAVNELIRDKVDESELDMRIGQMSIDKFISNFPGAKMLTDQEAEKHLREWLKKKADKGEIIDGDGR